MKMSKAFLLACGLIVGTASVNVQAAELPPIKPVARVDLPRFMGSWYVIASIPSYLERKAYNAVETYTLQPDGKIGTVFHYRKGSFDSKLKEVDSTGFVREGTNHAVWGVQIIWPFKAQYVIAYLDDNYSQTIIARDKRDYVWIMARTPTISQSDYDAMVARVKAMGYDLKDLRKVPQQWPDAAH
jgi:apolipoprotein D and lipocalin family protein